MHLEYSRSPLKLVPESLRLPWLISIDGDQGAGKTKLAKEIADLYAGTVVNVDDYLLGNDAPYLEQVKWEALAQNLQQNKDKHLVINGVLLEYVMKRVRIDPTYRIFMRHEEEGEWKYSFYLESKNKLPNARLEREIASYYRDSGPWLLADEELTLSSRYVYNQ